MKPHANRQIERLQPLLQRLVERKDGDGLLATAERGMTLAGASRAELERCLKAVALLKISDSLAHPALEAERRLPAEPRQGQEPAPLIDLKTRLELDGLEYAVLVMIIGPLLFPSIGRIYGYLRGDPGLTAVGLPLALELLDWDARPGAAQALHRALYNPDGRLVRNGLVHVVSEGSPLRDQFVPSPRLAELLVEGFALWSPLAGFVEIDRTPFEAGALVLPTRNQDALQHATERVSRGEGGSGLVIIEGAHGTGKTLAARALVRRLGRPLLTFDLRLLPSLARRLGATSLEQALQMVSQEARLLAAVPLFENVQEAYPNGAPPWEGIDTALRQVTELTLITTVGPVSALHELPRIELVQLPVPPAELRIVLWERMLAPELRDESLDLHAIATHYKIAGGVIAKAIELARGRAASGSDGRIDTDTLALAIQDTVQRGLGEVATPISRASTWNDLVVPPATELQLRAIVARYHNRARVLHEWGLAQLDSGRSISALFKGPPGTGKSLAATILGQELGLEVYRLDLSRVVDKYIGETEKRLERAFTEAESSGAILLFDEADSLFAKRTRVESANDRYANTNVNYLLQRLDTYDGIVLLTTNNASDIDDAFRRRIAFHVDFPTPALPERARLWRRFVRGLTAPCRVTDEQLVALAHEFDFAGAHIANTVVHAAYLAAELRATIDLELLRQSAQLEAVQLGRVVQGVNIESLLLKLSKRPGLRAGARR